MGIVVGQGDVPALRGSMRVGTNSLTPTQPAHMCAMQAMHKLDEKAALVRCRQADASMVKEVMEPARKQYTAVYGAEAPTLTLDQESYLPPAPTRDDAPEGTTWWVGRLGGLANAARLSLGGRVW